MTQASVRGFEAIVLGNDSVRATVIPALGGRVWKLEDTVRERQWLWHRENVPLAHSPTKAIYDDVWAGGWEELFPNDAPGEFEGRMLPDHGEWWTSSWTVVEASDGAEAVLRLTAEMRVRQATCTKEFRLADEADTIRVSYRIESHEAMAFHFLFKQHLPIAITPACRLILPGGRVTPVDPAFGTLLPPLGAFEWPLAAKGGSTQVDLSRVPPRGTEGREFVYVSDLPAPWCGVDDMEQQAGLRLSYDMKAFPFLWLFLSYGGWRDCYTAVLEPCTNMPKDLGEAVRAGRSAHLSAGGVFETSVRVRLSGLTGAA